MPSFKYYLKDSKANDETPIYLRYNERGLNIKFFIGKKIHPNNWNAKSQKAKKISGFVIFNALLQKRKSQLQTIHTQLQINGGAINSDTMREMFNLILEKHTPEIKQERSNYLTDYVDGFINSVSNIRKPNTIRQYTQSLRLLRAYELHNQRMVVFGKVESGNKKRELRFKKISFKNDGEDYVLNGGYKNYKTLTFDDIDLHFHRRFVEFMVRGEYSVNWIGKTIRNIKLFMADAQDDKFHKNEMYRHKKFKTMNEEVDAIYLTEQELELMYNFDFSGNQRLNNARDLFIIGAWTGLRYSDLSQLTQLSISKNKIHSLTIKTGTKVVIPIHHHVFGILDKYSNTNSGLPYNISAAKMNMYIKEIGAAVGLNEEVIITKKVGKTEMVFKHLKYELMQTHTMRRSFATNMYKMDIPSIFIMMITGHKTETSFMKYIKVSKEENAERIMEIWNKRYGSNEMIIAQAN